MSDEREALIPITDLIELAAPKYAAVLRRTGAALNKAAATRYLNAFVHAHNHPLIDYAATGFDEAFLTKVQTVLRASATEAPKLSVYEPRPSRSERRRRS